MTTVSLPLLARQSKDILRFRGYAHFDPLRPPRDFVKKVQSPQWVARHGFLPFVHVVLYKKKRQGKKRPYVLKPRPICYASHVDRYIYQWYAHLTSNAYEAYVHTHGFSDVAIAYRPGLGRNNVDFAKEAFDFIREHGDCCVIIADFSSFFDNLAHGLLKANLKRVLDVSELPEDHYKVFRSATRYAFFELDEVAKVLGRSSKDLRNPQTRPEVLTSCEQMREMKPQLLRVNDRKNSQNAPVGVPQGAPLSAVYANVYMIDFDQKMKQFADSVHGYYRRYSDDILLVVPARELAAGQSELQKQVDVVSVPISKDKTKTFRVADGSVLQLTEGQWQGAVLEYLGLAFDGKTIRLKQATINRFYSKLNRRLHILRGESAKKGMVLGKRQTYRRFSHLGEANRKHKALLSGKAGGMKDRTFFTYAYHADEILVGRESHLQLKGHMRTIRRFYQMQEQEQKKGNQ